MKCLLAFLLVIAITLSHLPPPSLAFRTGAPVESCYDHFIDSGPGNHPDVTILSCDDSVSCTYDLRVTEVVNEATLELGNDTTTYDCGRIYGIELIANLNSARGFLVQVRGGTSNSSAIIGTFLDPSIVNNRTGDTVTYQILSCKRSRNATDGQLFPNSATQINAANKLGTLQFYWEAPQCDEYDMIVNVTVWFTIVQTLDLARGPGKRPMLTTDPVERPETTTSESIRTSSEQSPKKPKETAFFNTLGGIGVIVAAGVVGVIAIIIISVIVVYGIYRVTHSNKVTKQPSENGNGVQLSSPTGGDSTIQPEKSNLLSE